MDSKRFHVWRRTLFVAFCSAFLVPASTGTATGQAVGPTMLHPLLDVRTVVSNLNQPTSMAFLGTNDILVLVPQVDADGNDLAGRLSTTVLAPLGTYTGWNLGRVNRWPNHLCSLQGSFIPFARTRAERLATGDARPSLEERYGDHAGYVAAVRAAAERLVRQDLLLPEDAARLIVEAEASDILL